MKIKPLHDQLLVTRTPEEEKTKGGIIIPDSAKEKPAEGKIVATGAGRMDKAGKRIAMGVNVGDKVLFSRYAGTEIKLDGTEYLMMREDDVLCVLDK